MPEWLLFFAKQLARSRGALLVVALLTVTASLCGAAAPLLIGRLMDAVMLRGGEGMELTALLLLGVMLLSELCIAARVYVSSKTMIHLSYALTEETLAAVMRTSSDFMTKTARGELLQRCTKDTKVIQQFGLATLPSFVQELLLACMAVAVISRWNGVLAVVLLAAYIILFIPVHGYGRRRGLVRKHLAQHDSRIRQSVLEKLETMKQIKLYGTERKEFADVSQEQEQWAAMKVQEGIVDSVYRTFPRIPDSLAPVLVFLFAGWQMMNGEASIGQLVTILAYIPAVNAPVRSFFGLYAGFTDIKARIHGIMDYLRLPVEPGRQDGLLRPEHVRGLPIVFDGVTVAGDQGDLLHDIRLTVQPGEHVAIVGPSGAGKSTLLKLLLRLQEPAEGEIRIGDYPLRQLDATHVRGRIGYVMQEAVLFRGTLLHNLTYLAEADRQHAASWLNAFAAQDIVASLPLGYETEIGANGEALSGGQRQLVGLVRTMLKQPDILLLDEATSSLDQTSENAVYAALAARAAGITRINVTHRLKGAALADRIAVIDKGRLVEEGTHGELLALQGLYARMWHEELERSPESTEYGIREGEERSERRIALGSR
ncbi:putative ABC transporter ATP-binding protein [Paenibacillus solanacearum]|uniref:ABC transporter ATP-binding protein n=1 Tax=Paenibacillus solanacearum TaxID=2048548 RepID=A0A916K6R2_9BACL|nr:ABC transporter ATP-binding protein [Paenibacillus solanacearum]CAG7649082.1 putative ABC transporter ATP-binding protein [Paenibacillus solanacearum]